jgi:hypothetical protein
VQENPTAPKPSSLSGSFIYASAAPHSVPAVPAWSRIIINKHVSLGDMSFYFDREMFCLRL